MVLLDQCGLLSRGRSALRHILRFHSRKLACRSVSLITGRESDGRRLSWRKHKKSRDVCGKGCEHHVDCPLEIDVDVKVRIGKRIDIGRLSCDMKNDVWLYFLYDRKYLIFCFVRLRYLKRGTFLGINDVSPVDKLSRTCTL